MVTSLSIGWPHTNQNAQLPTNQILNLICNRFCGFNLLIREATDVGTFALDGLLLRYAHTLGQIAWSAFRSDVAWGSPFLGQGSLLG